jgi:ferritin-like metal-binding protein YciE
MPAKKSTKKSAAKRPRKQTPEPTELLVTELREIYSAENQLTKALPRLSNVIESETVRELMNRRLEQAEQLIADLENVFEEMEVQPGRTKNIAAEGLLRDAQQHVQQIQKGPALDAVLIGAVQKLEHYCIAAWGTSRAFAQALEIESAAEVMQRAIDEGKELDEEFTKVAESEVNPAMLEAGQEGMEDEDEQPRRRRGGSGGEARA